MIAILVAVKQELRPILERADARHVVRQQHLDFHEGSFAGLPVAILALGVGKDCARIAAEVTIRCYRPDLIISAGFGGGLQESIADGDIVIGTEILELREDRGDQLDFHTTHTVTNPPSFPDLPANLRIHYGKVLTTDEQILKAVNKTRLGKFTGALAVDMETSAVAAVAAARGTDLLAVRCITDNNHESLPEEFNDFFVVGRLQRRRVLKACARSPRVFYDLAKLGYRARTAGKNLARFLEVTLPQFHLPALAARDL